MKPFPLDEMPGYYRQLLADQSRLQAQQLWLVTERERLLEQRAELYKKQLHLAIQCVKLLRQQIDIFDL